ncbi:MAG: prepilin peptidase [Pseudomonadota bacterium]
MQWLIISVGAALGVVFGSFLNVVIHRGPALWRLVDDDEGRRRGGLAFPGSYCPACGKSLGPAEIVPLASYIVQRGKCTQCSAEIPPRYPVVELLGLIAGGGAAFFFGASLAGVLAATFLLALISLAAIDLETGYLPDAITFPLIALGIGANAFGLFVPIEDAAIGAVAGYCVFWAVAAGYRALRGIDGLGLGDAKLLAGVGAWAGWQALAPTVLVAALSSLAVIAALSLLGKEFQRDTAVPFGPALAAGGAAAFIYAAAGGDLFLL